MNPDIVEMELGGELLLLFWDDFPHQIYRAIDALGGNTVRAQKTVTPPGIKWTQTRQRSESYPLVWCFYCVHSVHGSDTHFG